MRIGPLGIWEIILIVGVALLIFGPVQLPKIARGVGNAVRSVRDFRDEIAGVGVDDDRPRQRTAAAPPALEAPAPAEDAVAAHPDPTPRSPAGADHETTPLRPPEPPAG